MNLYNLTKAGLNVSEGLKRFGGNQALYEKYLQKFPEDPLFAQMCDAIQRQDVKAAFMATHTIRGVTGNLSMTRLYDDLHPLVEELRAGSMARVAEYLPAVIQDYQDVVAAISASL